MDPGTTIKLGVFRQGSEKTVSLTLGELPKQREARAEQSAQPDRDQDKPQRGRRDRSEQRGDRDFRGVEGPRLGLSLAPAGTEPGVVVAEVDPRGPAADLGFKAGDVILDVGGKSVATPAEVRKALGEADRKSP